ncbi:MAG TPA: 3-oxoacyl-ACP reductase family protein [Acidobacteriota bacterium]|nr:3-oxoacyl-ACP reductase family protein [Acidobacteriota bacterium]
MISLADQVVLITGGSRGIGRAAAILMAKAGAHIAFDYHSNKKAADEVSQQIGGLGRKVLAIQGNIAEDKHCREMVDRTVAEFGRLDVLVNNAGIWTYAPIDEMPENVWRETIEVNLSGLVYTTRYAVQQMKRQGRGRIINISSTAGQRGEALHSHYAATKGAIISLTKSWSSELAPQILVNCVAPGWVDTDMSTSSLSDPKEYQQIISVIPMRRVATAEEIAGPILFLASDLAGFMTGEIVNVNGGSVLAG